MRRRRIAVRKDDGVALALIDVGRPFPVDFAILQSPIRFRSKHVVPPSQAGVSWVIGRWAAARWRRRGVGRAFRARSRRGSWCGRGWLPATLSRMTLSGHGAVQRGALSVARVGSIPWEWRGVSVDYPPLPGWVRHPEGGALALARGWVP